MWERASGSVGINYGEERWGSGREVGKGGKGRTISPYYSTTARYSNDREYEVEDDSSGSRAGIQSCKEEKHEPRVHP